LTKHHNSGFPQGHQVFRLFYVIEGEATKGESFHFLPIAAPDTEDFWGFDGQAIPDRGSINLAVELDRNRSVVLLEEAVEVLPP
jgi:hypothetical protein